MKLYGYWRSSCSWRVRIAMAYKNLNWTEVPVHLVRNGGEQHDFEHWQRNPMAQVPVLALDDGSSITQSLAILEYLEERFPRPSLLPTSVNARARSRELAQVINSGIQPLQNLSLLKHLKTGWGIEPRAWARQFIETGLDALEEMVRKDSGHFLVGDLPSLADVCLIPQLYNARRFGCDMSRWHRLTEVERAAFDLACFELTRPERQSDARASAA